MAHHKRQREQMKAASSPAAKTPTPPPSRRKRVVFRITVLVLPLIILLVLEVLLRLFGYGVPTTFFVKSSAGDGYVANEKFAWQFFSKRTTSKPVFSKLPAQ